MRLSTIGLLVTFALGLLWTPLVVTAQQVRSYKPEPAHFTECARRIGGKRGWVHVAASLFHDIAPACALGLRTAWINRLGEDPEPEPDAELHTLDGLGETLDTLVP